MLKFTFQEATELGLTLARKFSVKNRKFSVESEVEQEFRLKLNPVIEEFKNHKALDHPLFQYLSEQALKGFNSGQFNIYRTNFLHRTEITIPSVARTVERAALSGDMQTVADTISNLYDEGGYGNSENVHSNLLLKSHNEHGEKIFGLPRVEDLKGLKKSPLLTKEVIDYRKSKLAIFKRSFPYIAGNTFAHELAADGMLDNFRKAFFEPYKGYYSPQDYKRVTEYFTAHKDDEKIGGDVEAQHAKMAQAAVERACKENIVNIPKIRDGGLGFLAKQSALWDGLLREIESSQHKGVPILPRPEYEIPSSKPQNPKPFQLQSTEQDNSTHRI